MSIDATFIVYGEGKDGHTPVEGPDTLFSNSIAHILDLVSEGEIQGLVGGAQGVYYNEVALQAPDSSYNFNGVVFQGNNGLEDQGAIPGFDDVRTSVAVTQALLYGVYKTISFPNDGSVTAVDVTIDTTNFFEVTSDGDTVGSSVTFDIEKSENGGTFVLAASGTIQGKQKDSYDVDYRVPIVNTAGQTAIRIKRTKVDATSQKINDLISFKQYTKVTEFKLTYPNSAIFGHTLDAKQFGNQLPSRQYHVQGIKVLVPQNYTPATRLYTGAFTGALVGPVYTNNPAWVFYDLITNKRYGLGQFFDSTLIDIPSLYSIAKWCDGNNARPGGTTNDYDPVTGMHGVPDGKGAFEPRWTCNTVITSRGAAFNVLKELVTCFRGILFWMESKLWAMADQPQSPVKIVTNANVINGTFTYSGESNNSRHSVVNVSWNDPDIFYRKAIEVHEDPALIQELGWKPTDYGAFGCTSRAQARRLGKAILYSQEYEGEIVTYRAGYDHTAVDLVGPTGIAPGDVILIADVERGNAVAGGRLLSYSGVGPVTVTLDRPVTATTGTGNLYLEHSTGAVEYVACSYVNGSAVITLTATPVATPAPNDLYILIAGASVAETFRVVKISEVERNIFEIAAVRYNSGKFAAIYSDTRYTQGDIMRIKSGASIAPPTNLIGSDSYVYGADQSLRTIEIKWTAPNDRFLDYYSVSYSKDNDNWLTLPPIGSTSARVDNARAGNYRFRITSVNRLGVPTATPLTGTYVVGVVPSTSSLALGTIANLTLQQGGTSFNGRDAALKWTVTSPTQQYMSDQSVTVNTGSVDPKWRDCYVTVQQTPGNGGATLRSESIIDTVYTYTYEKNFVDTGGAAVRTFVVNVQYRDIYGRAAAATSITVSNPTPVFPSNPVVTGVPEGISIIQAPAVDTDYLGMKVYVSLAPGFTPGPTNLVYAGPNTSLIVSSLGTGTHYVVTLPYDTFGDGATYTTQQSANPTSVANVLLTDQLSAGNYTIAGNKVTRTGGTPSTWPNSVSSYEVLIGSAYMSALMPSVDTIFGIGQRTNLTPNGQNGLPYTIYRSSDTHWYIYENGTNVLDMGTTFTSNTSWSITYDAVNVRYYADGVLKRTVAAAANLVMSANVCIYTIGSFVSNIRFSSYTSNLWSSIGGAGKPQDNATLGADATNLTATIGGPNLLKNSSFEGITYSGGTIGSGFALYSGDANVITPSIVAGRSINGHAQQISWTANTTTKGISLSNQGGVDNTNVWLPNKTMLFSFFAQATGAAVGQTTILGWTTAPTTVTAMYNPPLTSSWQRYVFKIVWGATVDTAAYISIANLGANAASTMVFDDIQASEGDYISPYVTGVLPQVGSNLFDLSGTIIGSDSWIKNSAVTITSGGALTGAGGGTVTLTGIAPNVDPYATRNRYTRATVDPGYAEDGAIWGDNSSSMGRFRFRRAGAWDLAATDGAQIGANLLDQSATAIATDAAIKNTAVSITPGGALTGGGGGTVTPAGLEGTSGVSIRNTLISITPGGVLTNAGGGTVTLPGIAPNVDPYATRNRYTRAGIDPGYTEDGASWGDTSGTMARYRVRRSGAWDVGATDGAQVGGNLLDQSSASIATDAAIKNTAVSLTSAGALTGAGGGAITALPADNLADGVTYGRYALTERTKLGGVATGATVGAQIGVNLLDQAAIQIAIDAAIKNSAVTITAAGALSGAGGGSITALLADNLADGSIYGRYALTERTKLGGVQTGATLGARVGTNLLDSTGASIATDAAIKNSAVTINPNGTLGGAGSGGVTIGGLGYLGDLAATRNRTARQITDPGYTEDGAQWFDNSGAMSLEKSRLGGVWYRTATDGSQVNVNLLDQSATAIASDAAIKNTAVSITPAGALTGAGGGAITALLADNLADGTTYGRYALTERTKLGGVAAGATVGAQIGVNLLDQTAVQIATDAAIKNTAVTITAAGALSGAGGGAITALLADNLADGTTYGRYALTERTKLTGVQAGATVGARVGTNLLDFAGASIATDAAIKNTAVSISAAGVLTGAGGGGVTIGGLGYVGDLAATRNRTARSITDPGYTEDGAQWFDNSGAMSLEKSRLGGIWYRTATDGSQVNINLLDQSATAITADSAIKNTAVSISAAGVLAGAGGGSITALLADNLADGTTYGRYALTERTKLGTVATGADVTLANTAARVTGQGAWATSAVTYATAAPTTPAAGDIWINSTAVPNVWQRYTGTVWVATTPTNTTQLSDGANLGGTAAWTGVSARPANLSSLAGSEPILNTGITISAAGALSGAGGGSITALAADNLIDGTTYGRYALTERTKLGGVQTGATVGAQIGVNLLDQAAVQIATDAAIKNTAISMSTAGVLSGAGGGAITALLADNLADGTTYGRYALVERTKLGGVQTGATVGAQVGVNLKDVAGASIATDAAIKNTAITISTAGVLSGAGGGAITALLADNLADGTTYGRYALTERTKLGGVATGATVGAVVGLNFLDQSSVLIATDAAIKNTAVSISAAGVLAGAGGGSITALPADNLIDGSTYGRYALTERTKLGGVAAGADVTSANTARFILGQGAWATSAVTYATVAPTSPIAGDIWINTTSTPNVWQRYNGTAWVATTPTNTTQLTDGANLGGTAAWTGVTTRPANLSSLSGTEPILNTGITISAGGVLGGAGGGTVTPVGLETASGVAIRNSTITISAAGALNGAGGGAITALAADNLIDGATYGRYALTERTKLTGVAPGATVGAQIGVNLLDQAAVQIATDAAIKNTAVTLSTAGVLSGAGGGSITALLADNLADGSTYGRYALTERTKLTGVQTGATVGARIGTNLLDFAGASIATDAAIKNSSVTITAAGVLTGAGGGGVTIGGLGYSGDLNATYGARVGSTLYDISNVVIATDAVIKNSAVTISAAGVLSGAGGGSITALAADNLIDGATYGRYALTERSKLGGVATGATVGAISGTNLYDSAAVLLTDKLIRNSYVENGIGYISRPTGGSLGGQAANATGMIKIVLPHLVADANATMIRFEVDIYEYYGSASAKYLVGGYTYTTPAWVNVFASIIGGSATTRPVYFGNDGTYWCVWIGDVGTVWQYPAVTVRNVQTSYGANLTSAWETGWAVTISTVARSVTNVSVPQPVAGDSIVGTNLLDQSKAIIATDAVIKNSAVSISAAGVLAGAGGGTVTAPGLGVSAGAGTALSLTGLQLNASVIPTIIGNSVTGIFNATGGWEQGAISKERTRGGASASCIVTVNSPVMFGLTTKSTPTAAYTQIDYALYFSVATNYVFYTNGANIATNLATVACTVGDQITVTHDNVKVRFFVNGQAVHIANVITANEQLRFMLSINDAATAAGGVSDCRFAATVSNDFADTGGTTKPQNNATVGADLTNLNVTIGGGNIVKNSSFEGATYTGGNGPLPAGFNLYSNADGASTSTAIVAGRTGGNAMQVAWTANTSTKGFYFVASAGNVDNSLMWQPNTTMMISYYAKATGVAVGLTMGFGWNTGPASTTAVSNPALTTSWQRYVFRLVWGAAVDGNGFVTINGGNGTATLVFDDVQVEMGDTVTAYGANAVARVASNLYDISNTVIATDAVIKNSAVTMSAAGVLSGAGGGSITALSSDNLADGSTYGRYALTERTKLGGVETGATSGDNLIANGGAELGTTGWVIDPTFGGSGFSTSTVQKRAGTSSFLLNKAAVSNSIAAVSNAISVNPGDTYTFTFWNYAGAAFSTGMYFSAYMKAAFPTGGSINRTNFDNYNDFAANSGAAIGVSLNTYTLTIPAGMYWLSVGVLSYVNCDVNLYFEVTVQKQIAWQANIGGVGKPANYADVTASQPIVSQHSATSGNALTTLTDTNGRRMNKFGGTGNARDADVVSFATTLPSVPTMVFLPGGNAASAGSNVAVQATGVSVSGFTMKARSQAVTAGATVNDGSTGTRVAGDPDIILIRSNSSAPFDGNFRFTFSVTVGLIGGVDPGSIDVQIYVRKSGSWVNVGSGSFGSTGSYSITVAPGTVDYAAGVAEFGMSKSASTGTGSALSGFGPVSYTLGSVVETILTPTGASAIPWLAILQ